MIVTKLRIIALHKIFSTFVMTTLLGCATGRGINEGQLNIYSTLQDKHIGKYYASLVMQTYQPLYDYEINAYIDNLGQKLVRVSTDPLFEYQFRILKMKEFNAFTVGGGYVYVTTGLVERLPHEAGLASVIAHETGHNLARHITEGLTKRNLLGIATSAIGGGVAAEAIDLFGSLGLLQYGRENELEADKLGLELAFKANYKLSGFKDTFLIIQKLYENQATLPLINDLLATHPKPKARIEQIEELTPQYKEKPDAILTTQNFEKTKQRIKTYLEEEKKNQNNKTP